MARGGLAECCPFSTLFSEQLLQVMFVQMELQLSPKWLSVPSEQEFLDQVLVLLNSRLVQADVLLRSVMLLLLGTPGISLKDFLDKSMTGRYL